MATITLDTAVKDVLDRLGDTEGKLWTTDVARLYLQDGYDQFCARTQCLFDVFIIENVPPSANWQTDFERWYAEQKSGWGLTDERLHYTAEPHRKFRDVPAVGGSYAAPVSLTSPGDTVFHATVDNSGGGAITYVQGGTLPQSTLSIIRAAYDRQDLVGVTEARMNMLDSEWEDRTGERPSWFLCDSEGLFYISLVPAADGSAAYDSVDGSWGTQRYRCGAATSTITYTDLPLADDTVVIGGVTYVIKSTLVAAEEHVGAVKRAATADLTYANLVYCINNSGGTSGTDYNAPLLNGVAASNPIVSATQSTSAGTVTLTIRNTLTYPFSTASMPTDSLTNATISAFALPAEADTIDVGDGAGFGILRYREDVHPSNGTWGTPRRIHPNALNTKVEVFRLGRALEEYPFEIPEAYIRYVYHFAMARLLAKDGPGQDLELSKHYMQKFEMGVDRATKRHNKMMAEREDKMGPSAGEFAFGLGDPQPSSDDIAAPA